MKYYVDKDFRTVSVRIPKTGKLKGRRRTKKGEHSDRTAILRIKSGERSGQIIGRTGPIKVRGSRRSRGTVRRTL